MAEHDGDRPRRRGPGAARTSRSALDKQLRALYAQYGRGEVPEAVIDLIHRLEAAYREAQATETAVEPADATADCDTDGAGNDKTH